MIFKNVRGLWVRDQHGLRKVLSSGDVEEDKTFSNRDRNGMATVVVQDGKITCVENKPQACATSIFSDATTVDLRGGSIIPALMAYGSALGLEEIAGEPSTGDGQLWNAFRVDLPEIIGDVGGVVRASDALQFSTRCAL